MAKTKNVRNAVLDAAVELIISSGSAQLTLDAVAAKAEVSKGGLLHHFRSKEALLTALIERVTQSYDEGITTTLASLRGNGRPSSAPPNVLLETYINRIFSGTGKGRRDAAAVLAVAAHQPKLLAPMRQYIRQRVAEIHAELPAPQAFAAMAILMVADGLWLFDALNLAPFEGEQRNSVRDAVVRWIHHEFGATPADALIAPTRKRRARSTAAAAPA